MGDGPSVFAAGWQLDPLVLAPTMYCLPVGGGVIDNPLIEFNQAKTAWESLSQYAHAATEKHNVIAALYATNAPFAQFCGSVMKFSR